MQNAIVNLQQELISRASTREWLPLAEILEYRRTAAGMQRGIVARHVNRIKETFDPRAVGTLKVSRRADGTLWILDGQHRAQAMRELGIELAECDVYSGLTLAEESNLWRLYQNHVGGKTLDIFYSQLAGGDTGALEILRAVRACGYDIAPHYKVSYSQSNAIGAVGVLVDIYTLAGTSGLTDTLHTIRAAYQGDRRAITQEMLWGFHLFLTLYGGKIDRKRLQRQLEALPIETLTRQAAEWRILHSVSKHTKTVVSYALLAAYNRGLREDARLLPDVLTEHSLGGAAGKR